MIYNPPQITGSGLVKLTPTGAVNGSNVTFVFPSAPTFIVSDNTWLSATDSNGGVNWSIVGTTVTMTVPPTSGLYGF